MKTREMIEILEEAISYLKTEEPKTGKLLNIISPVWNFCFSIRQKTQMKKEGFPDFPPGFESLFGKKKK